MRDRHPHQGPKTPKVRLEVLEQIPLVNKTDQEFLEELDIIGREIDAGMLELGREGRVRLIFAAVYLCLPGVPDRLVTYHEECGDRDGLEKAIQFAQRVDRLKLLHPDEWLDVRILRAEVDNGAR